MYMAGIIVENPCSICLTELDEPDTVRNLNCKHAFHEACWRDHSEYLKEKTLAASVFCPLCKSHVETIERPSVLTVSPAVSGEDVSLEERRALQSALRRQMINRHVCATMIVIAVAALVVLLYILAKNFQHKETG
jgi:Ring finger domain